MEDIKSHAAAGGLQLNSQHIPSLATTFNRLFAPIYAGGLLALFYYHVTSLLNSTSLGSFFISVSLFISDVVLAFMWATAQSFRMNPVRRREFPANLKKLLKKDSDFPAMDVFICTADPYKEPPMNVVNTALSVMTYDYPTSKISVYVSDDGGSAMTLFAFMEAARFAATWLPFCRKNDDVDRNPDAFFTSNHGSNSETEEIKMMYEKMRMKVENICEKGMVEDELLNGEERMTFDQWTISFTPQNHPTVIKVLLESTKNKDISGEALPNLIYVSREKSVTSHHNFKTGALNTLLRVSATMTNAPIILTLDCDTYSNDPQTPTRALCYFLDPKLEKNLGYIQFPQRFRGVSKHDIYSGELKHLFVINPVGMDGSLGPNYVGAGCFFVRRAFFGGPYSLEAPELFELGPNHVVEMSIQSQEVLNLAYLVASCDYENNTKWGFKLGFKYGSLVEDYFTGYRLLSEGWRSLFCNPKRAAFYGDVPITLLSVLNQTKRWCIGLLEVSFSKYNPITYGVKSIGLLMGLSYAHYASWPFWSIPVIVYSFLPQLALISGTQIFPKVWDAWFVVYILLFLGAYGQDLVEFIYVGGTFKKWWNDQRMWMIRSVSSFLFGCIELTLKSLGINPNFGFNVTSKAMDEEQNKRYKQELFEFGVFSPMFVPITTAAIVNLASFAGGLIKIWKSDGAWEHLFPQMLVTGFGVVNCWPVYGAMTLRNDEGKLPPELTFFSVSLALLLCSFATFFL
ncbi:cellulose synthase-like protein G3 [Cucumis melo var. makuwa]|uniref:Cellulose synthase-like protein G3 n=1 Tax=Cucumis melo var. makuwa TaxID=1194695 RepID=A0A5A7TU83_CUCMM|nr:cellulose synthase-like protein G3 [Cucumis melo var. makuwa]